MKWVKLTLLAAVLITLIWILKYCHGPSDEENCGYVTPAHQEYCWSITDDM